MKTKVNCIVCAKCGDIIYSRARHDFHWCSCGDIAVDGGLDYMRIIYKNEFPKQITKTVNASKEELFRDWNLRLDKFGVIKSLTR